MTVSPSRALAVAAATGWLAWSYRAARRSRELRAALHATRQLGADERAALLWQSHHDSLTGVGNVRLLVQRLLESLDGSSSSPRPVVLLLDLDGFKDVNDSFGHRAGDDLLRAVGVRISASVPTTATVARLGGDQFGVLLVGVDLGTAQEIAQAVVAAVAQPVRLADHELPPARTRVGLAVAGSGRSAREVLGHADVALSWAKERGHGPVVTYDEQLHSEAMSRVALHRELGRAIDDGELRLHYQPNVDLATGQLLAFEALVRWQHPVRGLLPPSAFVPLAEQSGLVVAMGTWVLREACRAGAAELSAGVRPPDIAVNISARQIAQTDFVPLVVDVLAESGLDPGRLKLEITESTLLQDRESVVEKLRVLRGHGIWVAVDDFGTGYSSLSYLADLPVDVLKIDKSFVDQIPGERAALVEAIVGLADSLRLITVAEGVERPEQAQRLLQAGCGVAQGYLWSRPVPLAEAAALLADPQTELRYRSLMTGIATAG